MVVGELLQYLVRDRLRGYPASVHGVDELTEQRSCRHQLGMQPSLSLQKLPPHLSKVAEYFEPRDEYHTRQDEHGDCHAAAVQQELLLTPDPVRFERFATCGCNPGSVPLRLFLHAYHPRVFITYCKGVVRADPISSAMLQSAIGEQVSGVA